MTIFWDGFQQEYEFHLDFKTGNRGEKNTLSINAVVTITPKKNRHYLILNDLRNTNHDSLKQILSLKTTWRHTFSLFPVLLDIFVTNTLILYISIKNIRN